MGVRGLGVCGGPGMGIESFCCNGGYRMCGTVGMGWDGCEGPWVCEGVLELIWKV